MVPIFFSHYPCITLFTPFLVLTSLKILCQIIYFLTYPHHRTLYYSFLKNIPIFLPFNPRHLSILIYHLLKNVCFLFLFLFTFSISLILEPLLMVRSPFFHSLIHIIYRSLYLDIHYFLSILLLVDLVLMEIQMDFTFLYMKSCL